LFNSTSYQNFFFANLKILLKCSISKNLIYFVENANLRENVDVNRRRLFHDPRYGLLVCVNDFVLKDCVYWFLKNFSLRFHILFLFIAFRESWGKLKLDPSVHPNNPFRRIIPFIIEFWPPPPKKKIVYYTYFNGNLVKMDAQLISRIFSVVHAILLIDCFRA